MPGMMLSGSRLCPGTKEELSLCTLTAVSLKTPSCLVRDRCELGRPGAHPCTASLSSGLPALWRQELPSPNTWKSARAQ